MKEVEMLSILKNFDSEIEVRVEYLNNDGSKDYVLFKNFSSALDFIISNFK